MNLLDKLSDTLSSKSSDIYTAKVVSISGNNLKVISNRGFTSIFSSGFIISVGDLVKVQGNLVIGKVRRVEEAFSFTV